MTPFQNGGEAIFATTTGVKVLGLDSDSPRHMNESTEEEKFFWASTRFISYVLPIEPSAEKPCSITATTGSDVRLRRQPLRRPIPQERHTHCPLTQACRHDGTLQSLRRAVRLLAPPPHCRYSQRLDLISAFISRDFSAARQPRKEGTLSRNRSSTARCLKSGTGIL